MQHFCKKNFGYSFSVALRIAVRLFVWILLLVIIAWSVYTYLLKTRSITPIPLIILKLPGGGSSRLTDSLNEMPGIYITEDIVQSKDKDQFTSAEIQSHLSRALARPTGEIAASRKKYWFSRRMWEIYINKYKFMRSLDFVGFTINPENCVGLDWTTLFTENPTVRLIILVRSNVVKSAVYTYKGEQRRVCQIESRNVGVKSDLCNQLHNGKVTWAESEFASQVNLWLSRYRDFYSVTSKIVDSYMKVSEFKPLLSRYESFQRRCYRSMSMLLCNLHPATSYSFEDKLNAEITDLSPHLRAWLHHKDGVRGSPLGSSRSLTVGSESELKNQDYSQSAPGATSALPTAASILRDTNPNYRVRDDFNCTVAARSICELDRQKVEEDRIGFMAPQENLKDVLVNYDAILTYLRKPNCSCISDMLEAVLPHVQAPCRYTVGEERCHHMMHIREIHPFWRHGPWPNRNSAFTMIR